jgi:hypothetical protein
MTNTVRKGSKKQRKNRPGTQRRPDIRYTMGSNAVAVANLIGMSAKMPAAASVLG